MYPDTDVRNPGLVTHQELNAAEIVLKNSYTFQRSLDRALNHTVTYTIFNIGYIPVYNPNDTIFIVGESSTKDGIAYTSRYGNIYPTTTGEPSTLTGIILRSKRSPPRKNSRSGNRYPHPDLDLKYLFVNIPREIIYTPTTFEAIAASKNMADIFNEPNWHKHEIFTNVVSYNDINEINNIEYYRRGIDEVVNGKYIYTTTAIHHTSRVEFDEWIKSPASILPNKKAAHHAVNQYYMSIYKKYYINTIKGTVKSSLLQFKNYNVICSISGIRPIDPVVYCNRIYSKEVLDKYIENIEPFTPTL